jgi:hypothetical protein
MRLFSRALLHIVGVGVVKSMYLATVTDATDFVGLDVVSSHLIEDGGIRRSEDRGSKHMLLSELVELLVVTRCPFQPVSSLEGSSRKFECLG